MGKRSKTAAEILDALAAAPGRRIEPGTPSFQHFAKQAWEALTDAERRVLRLRFPGRQDPTCDCPRCSK